MGEPIRRAIKSFHEDRINELSEELVKQKDKAYVMRRQIANLEDELLDKRYQLTVIYNTIGNIIDGLNDELAIVYRDYKKE